MSRWPWVPTLIERDGPWCVYCGIELVEATEEQPTAPEGYAIATIEHVVPKSAGGRNRLTDLVLACPPCNSAKGSKSLLLFLATRRAA